MNGLIARRINHAELKEQIQVDTLYIFSTLESLDENENIDRVWESIGGNIKFTVKCNLRQ
jgi:hypothetical protein